MKLKSHPSLQKGGANNIHDIEDLVELGHKVKGAILSFLSLSASS